MDIYHRSNLTKTQWVFWLGQKLNPDLPLYNNALGLIVPIPLDPAVFRRAFKKLVEQSDALRTVIDICDGVPQQRVLPHLEFSVDEVDLSDAQDPVAAFEVWGQQRCQQPFELHRQLFDTALVRLGAEKCAWYFAQHHIITDAFSVLITMRYLDEYYGLAVQDRLDDAPAMPPFSEYVAQSIERRNGIGDTTELAFWKSKSASPPDPLSFYGTPIRRTAARIHHHRVDLGAERSIRVRALALHEDVATKTPFAATFNIFSAALAAYIHRMNGNRDISIGMPFHNRRADTHKQTPGLFIGVLPLRISVDPADSALALIQKVAADASASLRCSGTYLHQLADAQSHDVLLNYLLWAIPDFQGVSSEIRWIHSGYGTDPLVINFYDHPVTGNMGITFDFNAALFDEEAQQLTVDHFIRTMDYLLDDPARPVSGLSLLSSEERERFVNDLNRTQSEAPAYATAHRWFEAQAAETPDATALVFESASITYAELNARANRIAHFLRAQGVEREVLVGLCVERSIEAIAGLLGILKSGGAYVPLDPSYPPDRLAFMVRDASAPVLLTEARVCDLLPTSGVRVVCLDTDWESIAAHPDTNPDYEVDAPDLAYVIYTSGSTGTPKGVLLEHGGLCNLIGAQTDSFGITKDSRVLQFASLSFDASVSEIFTTLCSGATLCLARQTTMASADDLVQVMREERITTVTLPPSVLKVIDPEGLPELSTIVAAGERCPSAVVRAWGPGRRFLNAYGPTEATVCATIAHCDAALHDDPSIGRPIANVQVYILDGSMAVVPAGVAGELYIGGAGVARGYLNREDQTAARFVPNPFDPNGSSRLYRTGDMARYRLNGDIEFLGRCDHQVKIRGYRIELGEIESRIGEHPDIADTVVVAREDVADDHRLVAYIVTKTNGRSFNGELRALLRNSLPEYMVPTAFVALDQLPLTPNGKVDRNALPQPDRNARDVNGTAQAARDSLELELKRIWEHVLDVRPMGVTDNFFDLGGHSLSAVQLMEEIERRFGQRLAPAKLFEAPTIERLAGVLRNQNRVADSVLVPIRPEGSKAPFFCVHPAPGTVFCYIPIAQHIDGNRPFYGLQAPAINGVGRIFDTIEETAACYVEAVRSVQPEGPYHIGGHSSGGTIAFEMARQLERQGHMVGAVILMDSFAPIPGDRTSSLYDLLLDAADDAMWLASVMMMVEYFFSSPITLRYRHLRKLDREAQYEAVLGELKRVNFLAPSAGPGAIHGLVENCRAGMKASMRYCPDPYSGDVSYLYTRGFFAVIPEDSFAPSMRQIWALVKRDWRAVVRGLPQLVRDSVVTSTRSGLLRRWLADKSLGWKPFVKGGIDARPVPGNHISMLADPDAEGVAAEIQACLDAADKAVEPQEEAFTTEPSVV